MRVVALYRSNQGGDSHSFFHYPEQRQSPASGIADGIAQEVVCGGRPRLQEEYWVLRDYEAPTLKSLYRALGNVTLKEAQPDHVKSYLI